MGFQWRPGYASLALLASLASGCDNAANAPQRLTDQEAFAECERLHNEELNTNDPKASLATIQAATGCLDRFTSLFPESDQVSRAQQWQQTLRSWVPYLQVLAKLKDLSEAGREAEALELLKRHKSDLPTPDYERWAQRLSPEAVATQRR